MDFCVFLVPNFGDRFLNVFLSNLAFFSNHVIHRFFSFITNLSFFKKALCPLLLAFFKYGNYLFLEFLIAKQKPL